MTYDMMGPNGLDYLPCRYGTSKLLFRGPRRSLEGPFMAFIGGTETYGKFVPRPFPRLIEESIGTVCVNFGQVNAGIDVFAKDPVIMDAAAKAEVTVIQILGAQNMTNRFYTVHPRRNDRFINTSALLQTIYREVDFADFHFTKHLLQHLYTVSANRFETVRQELQQAWLARMRLMLKQIRGHAILLWSGDGPPPDRVTQSDGIGPDPLFITSDMMEEIRPYAAALIEFSPSVAARGEGTAGMHFTDLEAPAAAEVLGPRSHAELAEVLIAEIELLRAK
ncbi:MAG: DUF6473 family protein [Sulfitobacter sp.]|nr:DUF6473 family protein [Sulfitobacter sp.]